MTTTQKLPFLPDAHHYAIAAVAARSAQLDHSIEIAAYSLLGIRRNTAKFLLKNLAGDRIIQLFQALLLDEFPNETDSINSLIARINKVRSDRNEIIHWLWGNLEGNQDAARLVTVRPFRETKETSKTASEIHAIADELLATSAAIFAWSDKASAAQLETLRQRLLRPSPPLGLVWPSIFDHQDTPEPPGLPPKPSQE